MSEAPSIPYLACPYMPAQSKAAACLDTLLPCSRIAYLLGFMLIQHLVVLLIWPAMCLCAWTSWARLRKERKGKKRHSFSAMALGGEGPNPEEGGETGGGGGWGIAWELSPSRFWLNYTPASEGHAAGFAFTCQMHTQQIAAQCNGF